MTFKLSGSILVGVQTDNRYICLKLSPRYLACWIPIPACLFVFSIYSLLADVTLYSLTLVSCCPPPHWYRFSSAPSSAPRFSSLLRSSSLSSLRKIIISGEQPWWCDRSFITSSTSTTRWCCLKIESCVLCVCVCEWVFACHFPALISDNDDFRALLLIWDGCKYYCGKCLLRCRC